MTEWATLQEISTDLLPAVPGLAQLRALTRGLAGVRVAVLDGPVDERTVSSAITLSGPSGHGTLVSSIIVGSRDGAAPGVAPGCTLLPIAVFRDDPSGGCSQLEMAQAIEKAVDLGAHVINVSAAQQSDALSLSTPLSAAIQRAVAADVLVVAATGNQGCACDAIPASAAGVLAIGAHGPDGEPLAASNWGAGHRSQGLLAPGLQVAGACVGGGVCRGTGTSYATAVATGVAALLMSLQLKRGHAPSGSLTRRVLLRSADRSTPVGAETVSKYLAGRLDVSKAVELLVAELTNSGTEGGVVENFVDPVELHAAADTPPEPDAPAQASAPSPVAEPPTIIPADCGCGCGGHGETKSGGGGGCACGGKAKGPPQLVYAIGRLGVSFVSLARRDAIWRSINAAEPAGDAGKTPEIDLRPISNASLAGLLECEPWHAQAVVWTLSRSDVPMYAIVPTGAFADRILQWMVEQWRDPQVEFISLPGVIAGQMQLYDGMTVDVVVPDMRGMYSWNSARYTDALVGALPKVEGQKRGAAPDAERIRRFLSKIYYRIRNRGLSPEERALNAAATNAFNLSEVVVTAGAEGLAFRDVSVERSPFNRPGGQYYDVLLTFFSLSDRLGRAPLVARFTIDVSDTVPVLVGEPVQWYEY